MHKFNPCSGGYFSIAKELGIPILVQSLFVWILLGSDGTAPGICISILVLMDNRAEGRPMSILVRVDISITQTLRRLISTVQSLFVWII